MTNRVRKKYDQRSARLRSRAMLPWRAGARVPPRRFAVAVLIVVSGLIAALADVAQDQDGSDRQYREHEQRHRRAERQVVAPDAERERVGREDMRLIDG